MSGFRLLFFSRKDRGMKKILISSGLAVLLASFGAVRAMAFEGSVSYHMTAGKSESDFSYLMKGSKMRVDMGKKGQKFSSIVDMKTRKSITLMHENKMYMTGDIPEPGKEKGKAKPEGKLVKTGNSEKILGRTCEEWLYTDKHGKTRIWLAKGMGVFAGMMKGNSLSRDAWVKLAESKGMFPLKTVSETKDGKTFTMVATDIQEKSLGDDLFKAPKNYKPMQMPKVDMGEALKNQAPKVKLPF
jgi:hypothetical protein